MINIGAEFNFEITAIYINTGFSYYLRSISANRKKNRKNLANHTKREHNESQRYLRIKQKFYACVTFKVSCVYDICLLNLIHTN